MKVVSTNIADVQTISWRGKSVETGIYKLPTNSILLGVMDVANDHVVDRKYHGGVDKACYIYSSNHYQFWKEKYPDLEWGYGMMGENITIEGLDETTLNIGDIYQLGAATVQVAQPRQPCFKLGVKFGSQAILKEFINAPYPGAYLRVLEEGEVKVDDEMLAVRLNPNKVGLLEVFRLLYKGTEKDADRINEILDFDLLPDETKDGLRKRLSVSS